MKLTALTFLLAVSAQVDEGPPVSAAEDLAAEAQAAAAQAISDFQDLVVTTLKEEAGYDDLDEAGKTAFDEELAADAATADAFEAKDRTASGYDEMDVEA